jgi:hypothetical protein
MTQIKLQPPVLRGKKEKSLSTEQLTNAAWAFANSTFFKDCQLSEEAIVYLRENLKDAFQKSKLKENAFLFYCKVCMIGSRYVDKSPSVFKRKTLWQHNELHGLSRALKLLAPNLTLKQRTAYLKSVSAVAQSYLKFVRNPVPKVFASCRDRILKISNEGMNQFFYNAVAFFKFL